MDKHQKAENIVRKTVRAVERFDGMMTTDMHNIMWLLGKTHEDVEYDIVEAIEREQKPDFDYDKYDTDGLPYLVRYLDSLDDTEQRSLWGTAVSLYDDVELSIRKSYL